MTSRPVARLGRGIRAAFRAPRSKSATHRALVAAALADGPSRIVDPLDADDTRVTLRGLAALGITAGAGAGGWHVEGGGSRVPGGGRVDLGESGTSMRFLAAVGALGARPSVLRGAPGLARRPMHEIAAALGALGAGVALAGSGRSLPMTVGGRPVRGGRVAVPGGRSSQFVSALLLVGARLPGGLAVEFLPPAVSLPYVDVTVATLRRFGVGVERTGETRWSVAEGSYPGREIRIEGDHSSVSCFLAAAAVLGGEVEVRDLDPASPQPDARLPEWLERIGCVVRRGPESVTVEGSGRIPGFDLDLSDSPDLAPAVAVLALFSEGRAVLRGLGHLRFKESDRLEVLADNLGRLGRDVRATADALDVAAPPAGWRPRPATIRTASDHRMAMAFAVAGLRAGDLVIDDAECVAKSYPGFWDEFDRLGR